MRLIAYMAAVAGIIAVSAAGRAQADDLVFMSTQLRPLEQAEQLRSVILKDAPQKVVLVLDAPATLLLRFNAEQAAGHHTISLVGALDGELQPLAQAGLLTPLEGLVGSLDDGLTPASLLRMGHLGTAHQLYVPWMQASYIMAANKQALPYLPKGADLNALSYDQLAAWAANITAATGKRMLGFPAGPTGLMHRFFQGYLYPSFTGGLVTTFRAPAAVAMWEQFRDLWKYVNPNSLNYGFMQEPLLSGDVWIGFDHESKLLAALRQKPDDFVTFPPPSGPKGPSFMPVLAGLAIPQGAPDAPGAAALIRYLTRPETQILTARSTSFLPVMKGALPPDLDPGLRLATDAILRAQSRPGAMVSLLPVGLGEKDGAFNKLFLDTFQLIVLRGQPVAEVLDRQTAELRRILEAAKAPCWAPDPPSVGACQVQ